MKKEKKTLTEQEKIERRKRRGVHAVYAGVFLFVASATAVATFSMIPQKHIMQGDPEEENGGNLLQTPAAKIKNSLLASVSDGLDAKFNKLLFSAPSKTEGISNAIDASGAELAFKMGDVSLHGINLALNAPISYNGLERNVDLALVNDKIYIKLADKNEQDWNFNYKVDVAAYDMVGADPDDLTGGVVQYEYGKLDWLISDIISILTDGGMDINFPSLSALLNKQSSTESNGGKEVESSSSEENSSEEKAGFSIDTDSLLASMDQMEETTLDGKPYFIWDMKLNEDNQFKIGLAGDADYNLKGIDFPAKVDGKEQGTASLVVPSSSGSSTTTYTIQVDLDIEGRTSSEAWTVPSGNFNDLADSAALFKGLASYVGTGDFGLDLNLDLSHHLDGVEGSRYVLKQDEVNDSANLHLYGGVESSWAAKNKISLDHFSLGLDFTHTGDNANQDEGTVNGQSIKLDVDMAGPSYVNVNDVLKASVSKSTVDELVGKIKAALGEGKEGKATVEETTTIASKLQKALDLVKKLGEKGDIGAIASMLESIKDGALIAGIDGGYYHDIVKMLKSIKNGANTIDIVLDLEPIGISGEVALSLNGNAGAQLVSIEFKKVALASFTIDGTLSLPKDYERLTPEESKRDQYGEMKHILSVYDQVEKMIDSKKFAIDVAGDISKEGTKDISGSTQGMGIGGNLAIDLNSASGTGSFALTERAKSYQGAHNIGFDLVSKEKEEQEDEGKTAYEIDMARFHYDSSNGDIDPENNPLNLSNPDNVNGINGSMSGETFSQLKDFFKDYLDQGMDDRFARLSKAFSIGSDSSILACLGKGQYGALAEAHALSSATFGDDKDTFVISGSKLGLDNDIEISLNFDEAKTSDEDASLTYGKLRTLSIDTKLGKEEGSKTDISLGLKINDVDDSTKFSSLDPKATYDSYDGLGNMIEYAANTPLLGTVNHSGKSVYDVDADVSLNLAGYQMNLINAGAYITSQGAEAMVHGKMHNVPVIKGINAPENARYFRENEYEGMRNLDIYYYANGIDPVGSVYMTRNSDYGRLRDVNDSALMSADIFNDDIAGWVLRYALGVDNSILIDSDGNPMDTTTKTLFKDLNSASKKKVAEGEESKKASFGSIGTKQIHIEDAFIGFQEDLSTPASPKWNLGLDLGKLLGVGILGNVDLTLTGATSSVKALSGLDVKVSAVAHGDKGGSMKLLSASISAKINNLTGTEYAEVEDANILEGGITYKGIGEVVNVEEDGTYSIKNDFGYVGATWNNNYVADDANPGSINLYFTEDGTSRY